MATSTMPDKTQKLSGPPYSTSDKLCRTTAPINEEETKLIEGLKAGDEEAFRFLYNKYLNRLTALAQKSLGYDLANEAEDAVQEVFIKVLCKIQEYEGRSNLLTWMYSILRNECGDIRRKAKVRGLGKTEPLPEERQELNMNSETNRRGLLSEEIDPLNRVITLELEQKIMENLSPEQKLVWALRAEGYTLDELAQTLGVNWNTLKVRVYRSRRQLINKFVKTPGLRAYIH